MYFTAALMLANGHLDDLYAEANRERLADLIRSTKPGSPGHGLDAVLSIARRILRVMRAAPRATAR